MTILSLVISPLVYFARQWHESRAERRRASQNIYLELLDTRDGLDTLKSRDLKMVRIHGGKEVYFMNRMFNHDFYDSLVSSGRINFVKPELQQRVQDVYHYIKDHNFCLQKIRDLEDMNGGRSADAVRYYRKLDKTDALLQDRIPRIMAEFKREYAARDRTRVRKP